MDGFGGAFVNGTTTTKRHMLADFWKIFHLITKVFSIQQ